VPFTSTKSIYDDTSVFFFLAVAIGRRQHKCRVWYRSIYATANIKNFTYKIKNIAYKLKSDEDQFYMKVIKLDERQNI